MLTCRSLLSVRTLCLSRSKLLRLFLVLRLRLSGKSSAYRGICAWPFLCLELAAANFPPALSTRLQVVLALVHSAILFIAKTKCKFEVSIEKPLRTVPIGIYQNSDRSNTVCRTAQYGAVGRLWISPTSVSDDPQIFGNEMDNAPITLTNFSDFAQSLFVHEASRTPFACFKLFDPTG